MNCQKLTLDAYANILDSLPYIYNRINYEKFDTQRIDKLLDKNILSLSAANFTGLKAKNDKLATRLIEIHESDFFEKLGDLPLEASDWLLVFRSTAISQQNKLSLALMIDDSIIINNNAIADVICNLLPINKHIQFRYEVLEAMFKSNNSVQKRVVLLNLNFSNLDDGQVQSLTEELGEDYAKLFMKQHKPVFPNNYSNIEFFNNLKVRDLIIRHELEDKGKSIRVFAKYQ